MCVFFDGHWVLKNIQFSVGELACSKWVRLQMGLIPPDGNIYRTDDKHHGIGDIMGYLPIFLRTHPFFSPKLLNSSIPFIFFIVSLINFNFLQNSSSFSIGNLEITHSDSGECFRGVTAVLSMRGHIRLVPVSKASKNGGFKQLDGSGRRIFHNSETSSMVYTHFACWNCRFGVHRPF